MRRVARTSNHTAPRTSPVRPEIRTELSSSQPLAGIVVPGLLPSRFSATSRLVRPVTARYDVKPCCCRSTGFGRTLPYQRVAATRAQTRDHPAARDSLATTPASAHRAQKIMRFSMKIAMMTFILTAVMSVSSYAAGSYNAVAAYGACQEDGLKGVHYALEGDCPNWEAWKTNHMRAQAPSQRHVYPTSTRRHRPNQ